MFKYMVAGAAALFSATSAHAATIKTDFVFMIDGTSSMAGEIAGVRNGFSSFVSGLNANNVDARFSVVVFGGQPELILDLTPDATAAQTALNNVTIGANPGIQNNHNFNPEASFETIRMVLGEAPNSELANNNIPEDGFLNFRSDARINLILATDEDSDRAFFAANRPANQQGGDAPSNGAASSIWGPWQDEIDATAQAVIDNNAYLNMLINRNDAPSIWQYGDYLKDVADADLLNYDAAATLAALEADPATANSAQAQILRAGLIARTFNIAGANDANFVNNFFAAKLQEVITDPGVDPDPTDVPAPGGLLLIGIGLLVLRRIVKS
ncbi:MAG: vWA domain-containing protein [Pseudomonadota bacterium]